MEIITLCIIFMGWIQCTVSPKTTVAQSYTRIMREKMMKNIHSFERNRYDHPHFQIRDYDVILINKVIGGLLAPFDTLKGFLTRTPLEKHDPVLGRPPINDGQPGEVEIRLLDQTFLFHTVLKRKPAYEDHGVDSGRVKYLFTIERGVTIFLAGMLENSQQHHVPDNVGRVLFVNHLYKNPEDTYYEGELFIANPDRMKELFESL